MPRFNGSHLQPAQQLRLDCAIAAARLGMRVIPLAKGAKAPVVAGWPELATTDPVIIEGWIRDDYQDCNFGLLMGNGWVCIDLDRHKQGQDGIVAMRQLFSG